LLRSATPDITEVTGQSIATYPAPDQSSHDDTALTPDTTFYYRVLVTDTEGLSSLSNEIRASTLALADPQPPAPVTLGLASAVTQNSLDLSWTVSTAIDFRSYTLLRSDTPGITEANGTIVITYNNALTVSHRDQGMQPGQTCYYRVLVTDESDLSSLSNEIVATTLELITPEPPTPAILFPAYGQTSDSLTLTWSTNNDDDFSSYALLADIQTIPDEVSGTVVFSTTNRAAVLFQDSSLTAETDYYYRVVTANSAGMTALSNEVIGTTLEPDAVLVPTPVTLGPTFNVAQDSLTLSWTENNDVDFDRYELYLSNTLGVTTADTLVFSDSGRTSTIHTHPLQ